MCWYCGSPVTTEEPVGRSLRCDQCGKDIRSCMNCVFFSPSSRDCRESQALAGGVPADRETANFCDWFSLDPKYRSATPGRKKDRDKAKTARTAFDNLFN